MRIWPARPERTDMGPTAAHPPLLAAPRAQLDSAAVYRAEFGYVYNALRRLGVRERDLPDVVHEVFIAVHQALPRYDAARPLRPWLFAIAYRRATDYFRRVGAERTVLLVDAPEALNPEPAADERMSARQDRALVTEALAALDLDRRTVLIMVDIEEHAVADVADALGIPLKTVYSRLRIAREELVAAVRRAQLRRGER